MHAVSTNQILNILHFNDSYLKSKYFSHVVADHFIDNANQMTGFNKREALVQYGLIVRNHDTYKHELMN